MKKIKKALITTAGFGTRFLPITKTIQKEMLPIMNRPLVDYIVTDCIVAGIEEIVFVINEHNIQIKHFYSENQRLRQYLTKMNKEDKYPAIAKLHQQAKFTFIPQPDEDQYGTAVPVRLAQLQLENEEAFLVLMGDDFIYNGLNSSFSKDMIQTFNQTNATALATCLTKPDEVLHKYGVAETKEIGGQTYLTNLVEKPAPGTAPSNLVNISKYIFTPEIFSVISTQPLNKASGELYITDSITLLAQRADVVIHTPVGEYLDGGSPESWLHANIVVARDVFNLKV